MNKLETTRFILRNIEASDLETLHNYWSDSVVTKYMNVTFENIEETRQMIDLLNSLPEAGEGKRWAIVDKESHVVLGTCGYHKVQAEHRRAEIGYELGREYWGKGVMQEVLAPIIGHCFKDLEFNRIEALVTVGNSRSLNTLIKLGFKTEGVLREYEFTQGRFHDQVILALLRREH
ncbi:gnat family acetyltransferase [hydrocarbon metagenome]|uniref:Gnat family acetyltransferase n=1 Tax=hydrocarbon metagenome TaxID=938273 RepID=A0A0W8E5Y1_9ZZZZ